MKSKNMMIERFEFWPEETAEQLTTVTTTVQGLSARQQAIASGVKQYQGRPCNKCGSTLKWVSCRSCVGCVKQNVKVWNTTPKGKAKMKESQAKYNQTPKGIAARKRGQAKYYQKTKVEAE